MIKTRVNTLSENITKWGAANVVVTNNDPKDLQRLQNYFDVIIVDAPCSGSGLFRKNPDAIEEWSEDNVQLCSQRQQRILADVLPALKNDGLLIYSTCSYSQQEDENIADWLIADCGLSSVNLKLNEEWNIIETISPQHKAMGYRFYPDKVKGEGFFIATFKKQGAGNDDLGGKRNNKQQKFPDNELEAIKPFLKTTDNLFFIKQNEEVIAMPQCFEIDLSIIQSALYIKKAGVKLGTIIRNELIPHHELALSTMIAPAVRCLEVDKEAALQYLRRNEIKSTTTDKGWALLTYGQVPLGWVKILPNRINNYYPAAWRILNK